MRKIFIDWYNTKYKTSFNSYSDLYLVPYDKKGSAGRRAMKITCINPNIPIITFEQWFRLKDCTIERYEIF